MVNHRLARVAAVTTLVALIAPIVPASADTRRIRCESRRNRYQYCRADTDNRVRIVRQLGGRCSQGRSWGYDDDGVWVDRGCRAEFEVGRDGGGLSTGAGVAIGAAIGAAVLGAVLASRGDDKSERAPDWMVGRFRGHTYRHGGAEIELDINRDGRIRGYADGESITGQYRGNNRLMLQDREYQAEREREGFEMTELRDRENRVFLWRVDDVRP
jgi:hypothetical protein